MATATDFISNVYDMLAKTFSLDSASTDLYLQMAWPGFSISPTDFKPATMPQGPYDPDIAEQTFSSIANIIPALSKVKFDNSGFEVDDIYELLLSGAIPVGTTADTVGTNPLYKLFSDASFEFLNAKKGSKNDPNEFYYPCHATPNNWYDEAAAASWPTITIASDDVKPPAPSSTFVRSGGSAALASQGLFKLKPTTVNEAAIKTNVGKALTTLSTTIAAKVKPVAAPVAKTVVAKPMAVHMNTAMVATAAHATAGTAVAKPKDPTAIRTHAFAESFTTARTQQLFSQKVTPTNVIATDKLHTVLQTASINKSTLAINVDKKVPIGNAILLKNLLNQQLDTKHVSTTTNGFSVSFKVCRVNIDRPWFKLTLLNTKNWYMFGTSQDEYSTGSADVNPGMFPFLPVSFIVIHDLKIKANWSQEDKTTVSQSVAFGPFDISNGSFNQDTIEVKGLQIIGWISRLTPALPPAASV